MINTSQTATKVLSASFTFPLFAEPASAEYHLVKRYSVLLQKKKEKSGLFKRRQPERCKNMRLAHRPKVRSSKEPSAVQCKRSSSVRTFVVTVVSLIIDLSISLYKKKKPKCLCGGSARASSKAIGVQCFWRKVRVIASHSEFSSRPGYHPAQDSPSPSPDPCNLSGSGGAIFTADHKRSSYGSLGLRWLVFGLSRGDL